MPSKSPRVLPATFYARDTESVAKDLLGCVLVHLAPDGQRVAGRIVETEAYLGAHDRACHSFGGRQTPRLKSMYLMGGHAYVYFIYGMHFCFNVVTRTTSEPEAVLIRALEPLEGIEIMRERRKVKRDLELTSGPGRLCAALAIDRSCDGLKLQEPPLFIEKPASKLAPQPSEIESAPRVGVAYAGDAAAWPLRFFLRDSAYVSKRRS